MSLRIFSALRYISIFICLIAFATLIATYRQGWTFAYYDWARLLLTSVHMIGVSYGTFRFCEFAVKTGSPKSWWSVLAWVSIIVLVFNLLCLMPRLPQGLLYAGKDLQEALSLAYPVAEFIFAKKGLTAPAAGSFWSQGRWRPALFRWRYVLLFVLFLGAIIYLVFTHDAV